MRVPQGALSVRNLSRLRISVYRIKGQVPERPALDAPLLDQFPEELRPVAQLRGIRLKSLPDGVQEEIKKALER